MKIDFDNNWDLNEFTLINIWCVWENYYLSHKAYVEIIICNFGITLWFNKRKNDE